MRACGVGNPVPGQQRVCGEQVVDAGLAVSLREPEAATAIDERDQRQQLGDLLADAAARERSLSRRCVAGFE